MADEPVGNLDTATGASIPDLLRELPADRTTILIITHDPGVAAATDRRIEIRDGRILSDTRRPRDYLHRNSLIPAIDTSGISLTAAAEEMPRA